MIEKIKQKLNEMIPEIDLSKEPMLGGSDKLYSVAQITKAMSDVSSYVLIQVMEREISETVFGSKTEAYNAMLGHLEEVLGFSVQDYKEASVAQEYRGDSWDYDDNEAWCSAWDDKYDWKIIEVS